MPIPDSVCISSDGVEIPVHKACVGSASPVLWERISKVSSITEAGLPILSFSERSGVLADLLRLCYPSRNLLDLPMNPSKPADILVALDKYKMGEIRPALFGYWKMVAKADPIRAYLAAARGDLRDCAEVACQYALRHPTEGRYVADLESSPALAYHHLLVYHSSCRMIAKRMLHNVLPTSNLKDESAGNSDRRETDALVAEIQEAYTKARRNHAKAWLRVCPTLAPATPSRTPQDTWLKSYVEGLMARADTHWDHSTSSPAVFEMAIAKGSLWRASCYDFAIKLSAANATLQGIRDQIVHVPLGF